MHKKIIKKKENEKKSTLSINIYFGVLFIKYILALSVHWLLFFMCMQTHYGTDL